MNHLFIFVASYGYAALFGLIFIESVGIPVPGEGVLIAAGLFAARTHQLNIAVIVALASLAAFLGTSAGYLLGRSAGAPLLARYGGYVGLSPARTRLGQYLFMRQGGAIIVLGRFVAFLRAFEGILAGINRMPLRRFLIFNVLGAVAWTSCLGPGAYFFGRAFVHLSRPLGLVAIALAGCAVIAAVFYIRGQEGALQAKADAALMGLVPALEAGS
jgi:membrane protein DedA with SNARE-associated domain